MSQLVQDGVAAQTLAGGEPNRPPRLRTFLTIWFGQTISIIGSGLSGFALAVWVYQRTGSATKFSLIVLSTVTPGILLSPVLGVLVDRYNRRRIMVLCNIEAGLCTLTMASLYLKGGLLLWQICALMLVISISSSLLTPTYTAGISSIVPKEYLGRASGMVQLGAASAEMFAPMLAGFFMGTIQLGGILVIDTLTYVFAVFTLSVVRFPEVASSDSASTKQRSMFGDVTDGIRYLMARRGLLALIGFFTVTNLVLGMDNVLMPPMVMSFAGARLYGIIAGVGGAGFLLGSVVMSAWGGPERRIRGVYLYGSLMSVALVLESLRPNPWMIAAGVFLISAATPIANGCAVPILQVKTEPAFQGRVFATMRFVAGWGVPLAYLFAGTLADRLFEPLTTQNGFVRSSIGQLIALGPGRGTALFLFTLAVVVFLFTVRCMFYRPLLRVESDIPDARENSGTTR